jgi:DNA polymerase III alpha subunit
MDREEKGIAVIQLRIKTEGSFGQTFAPIPRVIERLKAIGCKAACIMDTNSTWFHVKWFNACTEAEIQPMLGVELIVSEEDGKIPKMGFMAKNTAGLSELYRLASKSHRQTISTQRGSFPRLFYQDVVDSSDNILKVAGEITDGDFLAEINAIIDLSPASRVLNAKKSAIASEHKLRVVNVSDNAFCFPEDKEVYELISKGGLKPTPQYILDTLEHQTTATEIAAECSGLQLPKAPMIRAKGNLEQLCREGIVFRGMKDSWTEEYETRLKYELELIKSKDFESYFLIVADLMNYAKKHMLVGTARGSSAGSLVCYLTCITEIDPIPPGLFFERFIDISRGGWKFSKKVAEAINEIP